jgi:hypothetical protein
MAKKTTLNKKEVYKASTVAAPKADKKPVKVAKEPVVEHTPEEDSIFDSPVVGMVYESKIFIKREPISKDELIATVAYRTGTADITLTPIEQKYATRLATLITGDLLIEGPPVVLVSRAETPFEWIKAFPKAKLGDKFIGSELVTYYENN